VSEGAITFGEDGMAEGRAVGATVRVPVDVNEGVGQMKKVLGLVAFVAAAGVLVGCGGDEVTVPTAEVGECVTNDVSTGSVSSFDTVECTEGHTAEMFFSFDAPDGDYPGDAELLALAEEECAGEAFESYVGIGFQESSLGVDAVRPSEQTWNDADDRTVLCFAVAGDGSELTESVEGIAS
jgi:hypothetical protein